VDMGLYRFLLTGGVSAGEPPANPSTWLADKCWGEMCRCVQWVGCISVAFSPLPPSLRSTTLPIPPPPPSPSP
jgi:dynein heavy chain